MLRPASCCMTCLVAVMLGLLSTTLDAEPEQKQSTPADMVAALVGKNRPPKYVEHELGVGKVPLFSQDYDWKEYDRVRSAIVAIDRNMSPELWEELLKHTSDKRYSLTLSLAGPGLPDEDAGRDFTVGEFCEAIAFACLTNVYTQHSFSANNESKPWLRITPTANIKNLVEWRKKHADKPLWKLQVEACTSALDNVDKLDATVEQKTSLRKKLQSEIDKLNAANQAILSSQYICHKGGAILIDGRHEASYSEAVAANLRAKYGAASTPNSEKRDE